MNNQFRESNVFDDAIQAIKDITSVQGNHSAPVRTKGMATPANDDQQDDNATTDE